MRGKKYLSMLILTFLASLAIASVPPAQSSPSPVTFYIDRNPPVGFIPGVPVNQKVSFDVYVDASELTSGTKEGMVAWGMDLQVDPSVLAPDTAIGGQSGYFLYSYDSGAMLMQGSKNTVTGEWKGLTEVIMPTPTYGAGGTGKLVTLNFTSKSETGYSWIDVTKAEYKDANGDIHSVEVVYGHYTTLPTISIVSPENKTYLVEDVPLTFTVSESTSWIGYSLDGQTNVTITGNTTLSGLSESSHSLIVYAKDVAGNTGASEMVYFCIETPPEPETEPEPAESLQLWIVAAIVITAVVGATLLVYFTKVKKKTHTRAQY